MFSLVIFSGSVLASGLGPLLVLRVWQKPVTVPVAIAMMIGGIAPALTWKLGLNLSSTIYEVLPGMAVVFMVYGIAQVLPQNPPPFEGNGGNEP